MFSNRNEWYDEDLEDFFARLEELLEKKKRMKEKEHKKKQRVIHIKGRGKKNGESNPHNG